MVLSQSSENEGELALVKSSSNGISNTSLKELLAEAAEGNIEIQSSRYEHGDDDMKPVESRDTVSSSQQFRELSIPEKMQVIFKLPKAEEILGGKWVLCVYDNSLCTLTIIPNRFINRMAMLYRSVCYCCRISIFD